MKIKRIKIIEKSKDFLAKLNYIIYEHDHKYLPTRNPSDYKDFLAPKKNQASIYCLNLNLIRKQNLMSFVIIHLCKKRA